MSALDGSRQRCPHGIFAWRTWWTQSHYFFFLSSVTSSFSNVSIQKASSGWWDRGVSHLRQAAPKPLPALNSFSAYLIDILFWSSSSVQKFPPTSKLSNKIGLMNNKHLLQCERMLNFMWQFNLVQFASNKSSDWQNISHFSQVLFNFPGPWTYDESAAIWTSDCVISGSPLPGPNCQLSPYNTYYHLHCVLIF